MRVISSRRFSDFRDREEASERDPFSNPISGDLRDWVETGGGRGRLPRA
jgi:hypothetical protein